VLVIDNRSVKGRQRFLSVYTVVEADEGDKNLPSNPEPVDAVIKACGKVRRTETVPIRAPGGGIVGSIAPANLEAVDAIVADYRARIKEVVERAGLPHNLPPASETRLQDLGATAGPRRPALETAFKPMGLWLPRRIWRVSLDSADFRESDGRAIPGRRHVEPCRIRDFYGPRRGI
jgi:hypothetical protein